MTITETTRAQDIAWSLVDVLADVPERITDAFQGVFPDRPDEVAIHLDSVSSFEDAGVMSMDAGLVVRLADGAEFQITVVQSR